MSENRIQEITSPTPAALDFRAIIRLGLLRWRLVLMVATGCAFAAGLISLFVPNRYTATASILPTTNSGGASSLLSLAENIPGLDLSSLGSTDKSPSLLYPEILSSRMIAEEILGHPYIYKDREKWRTQNLYQYFKIENRDKAIKTLNSIVNFSTDKKTGVLSIDITTTNPQLSAMVANYYLECLDDFNQNQRKTNAGQNRQFIEKRMAEARSQLKEAEENLKVLRQRNMNYYNTTDPELAMLNSQLQREVEVKSQVYLTLCQQYELASIQEKKELPVIQILDTAQAPTIKSGPSRAKTAIIGFLLGMMSALAFIVEESRHPNFKQHIRSGLTIKRLNLIRKSFDNKASTYEHVEQY